MIAKLSSRTTPGSLLLLAALALAGCDKGPPANAAGSHEPAGKAPATAAPPTPPTAPVAKPTEEGAPPVKTAEGLLYGAPLDGTEVVSVDTILANPAAYAGKKVRVEGLITDVCPKRGCWFEVAGQKPGQKLRFKVQDGTMTFPMEAKGQHAIAEGVIAVKELSLEETRQYMEYQAKEYGKAYDPATVTEPTSIVRIDGTGAVLRDQK